ncbi:MAG: metallophosphoesterase [Methylomicrobium sp.]|nr:metallophosphoesterase [Methylomicrobium sp.]
MKSEKPYVLLSDLHFHSWSTFSTINEDGVNSRLQIIIDEVVRAKKELVKADGDTMVLAGDLFHTRGSISPEVLNPVIEMFESIRDEGVTVCAIPGNHDLSSKDSSWLTNAASALIPAGVKMAHQTTVTPDMVLVPWFSSIGELKKELERHISPDKDAIIHAPVDDIIPGLPSHGLDDAYLSGLGYRRVFSGHYHNFKSFGNGVYSIGATTHQTWSDVDSKAGFLLVYPDSVRRFDSHAPKFVNIYGDMDDEEMMICDGNYCRVKIGKATPAEINDIRQELISYGAKGVVIQAVRQTEIEERDASVVGSVTTLNQSVAAYVEDKFGKNEALIKLCDAILEEVEEVE